MLSLDCLPSVKLNTSALYELQSPTVIDNVVNLLTSNIQNSMWNLTNPIPSQTKPLPHLPSHIQTLISQKRQACSVW